MLSVRSVPGLLGTGAEQNVSIPAAATSGRWFGSTASSHDCTNGPGPAECVWSTTGSLYASQWRRWICTRNDSAATTAVSPAATAAAAANLGTTECEYRKTWLGSGSDATCSGSNGFATTVYCPTKSEPSIASHSSSCGRSCRYDDASAAAISACRGRRSTTAAAVVQHAILDSSTGISYASATWTDAAAGRPDRSFPSSRFTATAAAKDDDGQT